MTNKRTSLRLGLIGLEVSLSGLLAVLGAVVTLAASAIVTTIILVMLITSWADPAAVGDLLDAILG